MLNTLEEYTEDIVLLLQNAISRNDLVNSADEFERDCITISLPTKWNTLSSTTFFALPIVEIIGGHLHLGYCEFGSVTRSAIYTWGIELVNVHSRKISVLTDHTQYLERFINFLMTGEDPLYSKVYRVVGRQEDVFVIQAQEYMENYEDEFSEQGRYYLVVEVVNNNVQFLTTFCRRYFNEMNCGIMDARFYEFEDFANSAVDKEELFYDLQK